MIKTTQIAGLDALQKFGLGNSEVRIAVLDGFLDLNHPCFNKSHGRLTPISNEVYPSASGRLALKHGTAVCSLIFGKPGSEVEGIAPGCTGVIIPIYSEDDNGNFHSASQVLLARSIEIAIDQGANIINISGGQLSNTGDPDEFLKQAIEKCCSKGILIIAASGNEGCNCLHVPAAHPSVLAVGSMDEEGNPTAETNFGVQYQVNGILAPGKNLIAALPGGGTFVTNGATSYATPVVTGVAALLMSLQLRRGHPANALIVRSIIERTAITCVPNGKNDCRRFMRGTLNIAGIAELIERDPGVLYEETEFIHPQKFAAMNNNLLSEKPETMAGLRKGLAVEPACACSDHHHHHENNDKKEDDTDETDEMKTELAGEEEVIPSSITGSVAGRHILSGVHPPEAGNKISNARNQEPLLDNSINIENMETAKTIGAPSAAATAIAKSSLSVNPSGEIDPSDCGCGCGGGKAVPPAIVYALGTIGYDFGSESHRDSFIQSMGDGKNPHNPADLIAYLKANPWDASEILWTLNIDATPIYALYPSGPYSNVAFERIVNSLEEQQNGNIQRLSVPGVSEGTTSLLNGQTVANLYPNIRGMYSWTTSALVAATSAGAKGASKVLAENVTNFLNRIYYKMRNLGVTAEERALNYSATNAYQVSAVFSSALKENLELDDIVATKSPICRPGSDCYDVVLTFFNPRERLTQARREYRFTVDVSDVVPVTVGEVRSWSVY